ncbi:glycogen synthase [Patescibacteria group bacterium]|nr:glycogen synthase [Patescibacteria group bacterium]
MPHKLKIVSIASEVYPFSKSGGLADVVCSLSKILKQLGHDIIVITPFYGEIIDRKKYNLKPVFENVSLEMDKETKIKVNYLQGYLDNDLPIYFVANEKFFSRKKELYGSTKENKRFYLFDVAALKLIDLLKFRANIIHCHDWHAGLVPELLHKNFNNNKYPSLKNSKTVFTIHNLAFQLGYDWWQVPLTEKDYGRKALPKFYDPKMEYINFAKRAITHADIINTVSEQYAEEILTKDFGQDLQRILNSNKKKLFGIINGIDEKEYNPATDPGLAKNYSVDSLYFKKQNKEALQKLFNLPVKDVPVIGMTSRLVEQKGFNLLDKILETLLSFDLHFIIMGDGDKKYVSIINKMEKKYPKKLAYSKFEQKIETSIYAGGDMLLMPSRFEPCGLNQLYALRYGCIPIVHKIGGLADTITEFNPKTNKGNGFTFKHYHEYKLLMAITRAMVTYQHKDVWKGLVEKAMRMSSFWTFSAKKYVVLYKKVLKI